ncbi:MAG: glutamate 5-kinase [Anaerolineales bacterium]|nr:glutamate 5-kinase [Anaerolineales bacterium]
MLIVVKLGTSTLTSGTPKISPPFLVEFARQITQLQALGHQVILVSSGAMAAGREKLGYPQLPKGLPAKQMLAAIGQPRLMAIYEQIFGLYGRTVAQVLLTRADLADRRRYLNARNTLTALIEQGTLPIINENDTVATEEIRVGDNDNLSALVANVVEADMLILLTDQQGLFTADPRTTPDAKLVEEVNESEIPQAIWESAGGSGTKLGTGGMVTKLQAADLARRSGTMVVIAQGTEPNILTRLANNERIGTRFMPVISAIESRKRYILSGRLSPGQITVNDGAASALKRGGSLLPIGMTRINGDFDRGDTVRILDESGRELARGISTYSSADLARLRGRHSDEIESLLGYDYGDEVIHHNDLILL